MLAASYDNGVSKQIKVIIQSSSAGIYFTASIDRLSQLAFSKG